MKKISLLAAPALLALVNACSSPEEVADDSATTEEAPAADASASPVPEESVSADTLTLEGLGDLRIGQPLPEGGTWAVRGAQISDACQTASSDAYPDTYALITDGVVRRISVSEGSAVTLVEGIGPGSSESDVRGWFGGFTEEPHKYWEAPAKYLTAPNAESGDPALRFEINPDGEVATMHIGTAPELQYVEGCA